MIEDMQNSPVQHSEKIDVMGLVYERAQAADATIALPDTEDERIGEAVKAIEAQGLARPVLITPDFFANLPPAEQGRLIQTTMEARASRNKPISHEEAQQLLSNDSKYVAAAMVRAGMADGYVAGNT